MKKCHRCGLADKEFKLYPHESGLFYHLGAAVCVILLKQEVKRLTKHLRRIADTNFMLDGLAAEDLRQMAQRAIEGH